MRSWRTWLPPDPGGEAGGPRRAVAGSRACSVERRSGSSSCGGKTGQLVKDHLRPTLCSPELSLWAQFLLSPEKCHMGVGTFSTPLGLAMGNESWVFTEGLWRPNTLTYWPQCTCWATDSEQVLKPVKVLYKISSPLSREKSHLILKGADHQTSS